MARKNKSTGINRYISGLLDMEILNKQRQIKQKKGIDVGYMEVSKLIAASLRPTLPKIDLVFFKRRGRPKLKVINV